MILLLKIKSGLSPCKIAIFQGSNPHSFPCLTFVSEMLIMFFEKQGFIELIFEYYFTQEKRWINSHIGVIILLIFYVEE